MGGRGAVRSSARLSGVGARGAAGGEAGGQAAGGAARGPGSAAAAQRRALAAERAREVEDSPRVLRDKCRRLARALRNAKHLVVYTGAGISTAADIPDYRGPAGVWTRLRRGERVGRVEVSAATPTYTHMALTALWARGTLKFVVSQNCDGLHLRAGLPRRALAELHGDMFCELCAACRRVYLRAFDTTERTARHRHGTRRLCHGCGGELRDSIVHFGERGRAAWPLNWAGALRHARRADVVLCLGSSLKVLRRYPRLWSMQRARTERPALYIVNLQWTPKDAVAALKINARCDAVMRQVARRLRLRVPRYRAADDPLLAHAEPLAAPEEHTTRRPLLPAPLVAPFLSPSSPSSSSSSLSSPSSTSASDSDEEVPLRRLADRLRRPCSFHSFQVSMHGGEATILLRTEHAPPTGAPAAARPPPAPHPPRPAAPPPLFSGAAPPSATTELRRVRIARPFRPVPALVPLDGTVHPKSEEEEDDEEERQLGLGSRLRRLLEYEPRIEPAVRRRPETEPKTEPKEEAETKPKVEPKSDGEGSARSLAAAIYRRAVLVCRASLYPGLHTIVGAPLARPQCSWCARRHAARRCLWYGPPRCTPLAARAWRRVRARRLLCACCPPPRDCCPPPRDCCPPPRDLPAAPAAPSAPDDGGWYGKGYRKGRRKRR